MSNPALCWQDTPDTPHVLKTCESCNLSTFGDDMWCGMCGGELVQSTDKVAESTDKCKHELSETRIRGKAFCKTCGAWKEDW